MDWKDILIYIVPLFGAAVLSAILASVAWRRRPRVGAAARRFRATARGCAAVGRRRPRRQPALRCPRTGCSPGVQWPPPIAPKARGRRRRSPGRTRRAGPRSRSGAPDQPAAARTSGGSRARRRAVPAAKVGRRQASDG